MCETRPSLHHARRMRAEAWVGTHARNQVGRRGRLHRHRPQRYIGVGQELDRDRGHVFVSPGRVVSAMADAPAPAAAAAVAAVRARPCACACACAHAHRGAGAVARPTLPLRTIP
jgi:hypothetical protein